MRRFTRRLVALGLTVFVLGSAVLAGNAALVAANHYTVYSIRQGGNCYELTPLGNGTQRVETFYDYRAGAGTQFSSYGTQDIQVNQESQIFFYRGVNGTSLVFLHDKLGGEKGGAVTFNISGLPVDGKWVVMDDTYGGSDDNFNASETSAKIDWMWSAGRTDGAVFQGVESHQYGAIRVEPSFSAQSWAATERDSRWPFADDPLSWWIVSGDGSVHQLNKNQPILIDPGPCSEPPSTVTTTQQSTTQQTTTQQTTTGGSTTTHRSTTTTGTPSTNTTTPPPTSNSTTQPPPTNSTTQPPPTTAGSGGGGGGSTAGGGGGSTGGSDTGDSDRSYDAGSSHDDPPEMSVDVTHPDEDTVEVSVADPQGDEQFQVESMTTLTEDRDVSFRGLDVSVDVLTDFGVRTVVSQAAPADIDAPTRSDDGFEPLSYLTVEREDLPSTDVFSANYTFSVDETALDGRSIAPEDVAAYRLADDGWQPIPTERVEEDDGAFVYVARSSNLSTIVVGANRSAFSIESVDLNEETIQPGEEVEVRAVVANTGRANGTATANFSAFGEVVDVGHVRVPAGETRTVVFTHQFDEAGTVPVSVDGVDTEVEVLAPTDTPTEIPTPTQTPTPGTTTGSGQAGFGLLVALAALITMGSLAIERRGGRR